MMTNTFRLDKCKECDVPFSVVPVDLADYMGAMSELRVIEAFLIDLGYMDTAKKMEGNLNFVELLLRNYARERYGEED